jgi:Spy/CpxP family protein refolding chaperone
VISKRIALAAAALMTAGVAVTLAQPPPDPMGFDDLEAPALYADAGPGGPGPGGPRGFGPPGHRGPGGPGGHGVIDPRRLAHYLDLTDEQRASARQLFEQQRDKVRPLFEQQRGLREQLETTLDDPAASDAALGQLVKQLHANRQAMKTARQELRAQLTTLLDTTQKAKLDQLETVMQGLRGARHSATAR